LPRKISLDLVTGRHPDYRKEAAYEPSVIDSSTRRRKQIDLWMTCVRWRGRYRTRHFLDTKIKVDQRRFDV
jgi:hypothetical protein